MKPDPADKEWTPPNGLRAVWWSDDGSLGFVGHWQDGKIVQDRHMNWLEEQGGGDAGAGLFMVVASCSLCVGIPLGALYLLVRFVKWAWAN